VVKDSFAISIVAIAGANFRFFLSRLAAREFGPVFPAGTLIINVLGSFIVGFFVIWTNVLAQNLLCLCGALAGMALARAL
jgi:fluoride ion exporter CrcB/FEX